METLLWNHHKPQNLHYKLKLPKDDIAKTIDKMNDKEKEFVIRDWIEQQRKKRKTNKVSEAKRFQEIRKFTWFIS